MTSRASRFLPAILLLLAGMSVSPSLLGKLAGLPSGVGLAAIVPILALSLLFVRRLPFSVAIVSILWLQMAALMFIELHHGGSTSFLLTVPTLFGVLVAYLALESGLVGVEELVHAYVVLMIVLLFLAAISVLLALVGKVHPLPVYGRGTSGSGGTTVYVVGFTMSNAIIDFGNGYFVRPSGLFDEPGQFGIMVTLAILANAVVMRRLSYEILLIVLGLFTVSLGFYVSIFLYLMLWRLRIWGLASIALLLTLAAGLAVEAQSGEGLIYSQTVGRVVALFSSESFGGNRFADSVTGLDLLWEVGFWGFNAKELSGYDTSEIAATFFGPFMYFGLLGGVILYAHIFFLGAAGAWWSQGNFVQLLHSDSFRVFVVMVVSLYHRSSCLYFLYYLMLLAIYIADRRRHSPASPLA